MNKKRPIDKKFLWITLILLIVGVTTFISASLGVYAENKIIFKAMMIRHLGLGVVGGLIAMYIFSKIPYDFWKKTSLLIFIAGVLLTLMVFVPGLGFEHGGAKRWVSLGFVSFQPAEMLKFAVIVFLSAWFSKYHEEIKSWKKAFIPFLLVLGIAFSVLVTQPDSGTSALIGFVAFCIYWVRGMSFKHFVTLLILVVSFVTVFVMMNPYIIERIKTFNDVDRDPYGASYQIRQSKIAIGSGKIIGRGLGQSVHKFGPYLPESNSDSIFAIYAEEYGFIGGLVLISLYSLFAFFGLRISKRAPSIFAQNLALGITLLIVVQVFFNIGAISGIVPLDGMPLLLMSNGGTALFVTLAEIGIILNISRYQKRYTHHEKEVVKKKIS